MATVTDAKDAKDAKDCHFPLTVEKPDAEPSSA